MNETTLSVGDRLIDNGSREKNVVQITSIEDGIVTVFSPIATPQEGKAPIAIVNKMVASGAFAVVK